MNETEYTVPAIARFSEAAPHVGARTGAALRMRFKRHLYPDEFLVKLSPTVVGVDLHSLLRWLRGQREHKSENVPAV